MTRKMDQIQPTVGRSLWNITNEKAVFLLAVVFGGLILYQFGAPEPRKHDGRRASSRISLVNQSTGILETLSPSTIGPRGKYQGFGKKKVSSRIRISQNTTLALAPKADSGTVFVDPPNTTDTAQKAPIVDSLRTYMLKLQQRYNFDLKNSFSGYTLDYALGQRGINMAISRRFAEQSDDGVRRVIRTKEEFWIPDPKADPLETSLAKEPFAYLTKKAQFLSSDPIPGKYGLTNVLMVLASFFAYASMDNRVIVFPEPTSLPLPINELLDLDETQVMLSPLNVVFLEPKNESLERVGVTAPFFAKSTGYRFPQPTGIHPTQLKSSFRAYKSLGNTMFHNKQHRYFVQRDFFLHFPFGVFAPFDMCFFIKRMVFHQSIRQSATNILGALRDGIDYAPQLIRKRPQGQSTSATGDASPEAPTRIGGRNITHRYPKVEEEEIATRKVTIKRLMSVHLRLEFDAGLIDKNVNTLHPDELSRFFLEDLIPVARQAHCDAIYICSGKLSEEIIFALRTASRESDGFPLLMKHMIPANVSFSTKGFKKTTSHKAAASDALILAHSAIAVVFYHSTFALSVAAQRCPSPGKDENTTLARWRYGSRKSEDLVRWSTENSGDLVSRSSDQNPPFNGPKPDLREMEQELEAGQFEPGFFTYTFKRDKVFGKPIEGSPDSEAKSGGPAFSRLHWVDCADTGWCRASTMKLDKSGDATMGEHDSDLGI